MAAGVWKARLTADEDVDAIAGFIAADNIDAALRFLTAVREAYELLAAYPRAGPARRARSTKLARLRSWPIGGHFANYVILYLECDFGVEILRVVHGARDLEGIIEHLK